MKQRKQLNIAAIPVRGLPEPRPLALCLEISLSFVSLSLSRENIVKHLLSAVSKFPGYNENDT